MNNFIFKHPIFKREYLPILNTQISLIIPNKIFKCDFIKFIFIKLLSQFLKYFIYDNINTVMVSITRLNIIIITIDNSEIQYK